MKCVVRGQLEPYVVHLTLSRRNLMQLLAHLDDDTRIDPVLMREGSKTTGEATIVVQAQEDDVHYPEGRESGRRE